MDGVHALADLVLTIKRRHAHALQSDLLKLRARTAPKYSTKHWRCPSRKPCAGL
jgi:hypothetical protein